MKQIIKVLSCLIIITSFAGCSTGKDSTASTATKVATTDTSNKKLTNIENDAYIIYSLSYKEALALNGASSDSIKIDKTSNKTTYKYVDHVLSCGTYMNGEIVDEVKDNVKTQTGSFNVTKNPYEITSLTLSITEDTKANTKTGYLNANGQKVDINSKFTTPTK